MKRTKNDKLYLNGGFLLLPIMMTFGMLISSCGGGGGASTPPLPWYAKANVYQVYGSNLFNPVGSGIPDVKQSDWEYIGEDTTQKTFTTTKPYNWILVSWSGTPTFYFDAIVINGSSLTTHAITVNAQNPKNLDAVDLNYAVTTGPGCAARKVDSPAAGTITVYVTTIP